MTMLKPLTVWITTNWGKFLKRWEHHITLPASCKTQYAAQEATVRTRNGKMAWLQIGKEYVKAVYCHSAYLTYMQSSVQLSCSVVSNSLQSHWLQQARLPCPSPTPTPCSNSCPLSRWCHPAISSSVIPFSSCLQSLPASGSFPMSRLFTSGGPSIGAAASVLPVNTQDWFLFRVDWFALLASKGLSRVFSNRAAQKHQFFGAQLSLWSNAHNHTWILEKL